MNRIGILYHPKIEATRLKGEEIKVFLARKGVTSWLGSSWEADKAKVQASGSDLLLPVGGDGTILRAAQIALPRRTPITGVNLGKLGFLTELDAGEIEEKLPRLLGGEGKLDERAMLRVAVAAPGRRPRIYHALNDVVVARGSIARVIRVEASVDGRHLLTYRADGVIAATATGSTGYALAAGGPVIHPASGDFVLVPVANHLGPGCAVVLPGKAELRLEVATVHPATISIDGHINLPLSGGDIVTIRRSPYRTRFLRLRSETAFYGCLEEKLKGIKK